MRMLMVIFATCFFAALGCAIQTPGAANGMPLTYELYSWQDSKGAWKFCLLYTTNRQKTAKEVFNKQSALHGVDELKRKLSALPASSDVVWFDRLTLGGIRVKGTERLKYPPREVVEDVKRYAEEHHIRISGPEHVYP